MQTRNPRRLPANLLRILLLPFILFGLALTLVTAVLLWAATFTREYMAALVERLNAWQAAGEVVTDKPEDYEVQP